MIKQLFISGKIWLDSVSFAASFPQLKVAVFILWCDSKGVRGITGSSSEPIKNGSTFGNSSYEYENKIAAYRDMIRYAMSPDFPLDIRIKPKDVKNIIPVLIALSYEEESSASVSSEWSQAASYFLGTDAYLKKVPVQPRIMIKKEEIIENVVNKGFEYFEVKSQPQWSNFDEMYGEIDITRVPANTISYAVTGLPPPVEGSGIDWQMAEFWSALFTSSGMMYLNAVARNFPVKVKTFVTNWKNPDQYLQGVVKTEDKDKITTTYTWVFQDFIFEIDSKQSMVVKYNRGKESVTFASQKSSTWKALLTGAAFLAAFAAAGFALGAWGGAGAVAGAPSSTAAASSATLPQVSSITLTAPALTTPAYSITGLPALVANPAFMSGGITAAGATGTLAASSAVLATITKTAPGVAAAIAKAGIGLWSAKQQAAIAEEMAKAGLGAYTDLLPVGMTSDGQPVYAQKAGLLGGIDPKILLIAGGAIVLALILRR